MNNIEKIRLIESDIRECYEYSNGKDEFFYPLNEISEERMKDDFSVYREILVSEKDKKSILSYLKDKGRIDFNLIEGKKECVLFIKEVESILDERTLEFVAKKASDLESGYYLKERMEKVGFDKRIIVYSNTKWNTKWRMLKDAFLELSVSTKEEDHKILFKFIEEFMHPLMYEGDFKKSEEFEEDLNKLLIYDGYKSRGMRIVKNEKGQDDFINYILDKRQGFETTQKSEDIKEKDLNFINKITIIEPKSGYPYRLYVNNDIKKIKVINDNSNWLRELLKIKEIAEVDFNRTTFDYLNSNKKSIFYSSGDYNLTGILVKSKNDRKGKMRLSNDIELDVITDRQFVISKNKKIKS